jgi:hypothetical protein
MVRRGAKKAASRSEIPTPVTTPESPSPVVSEAGEEYDYGNADQYTSIADLWQLDGNPVPVLDDTRSLPSESEHQEQTTLLSYLVPINTHLGKVAPDSGQVYTSAAASTSDITTHHHSADPPRGT